MGLIETAKAEFKALGYEPIDTLPDNDPNRWVQENVIELLTVFSNQGHSGSSAPYVLGVFNKLAHHKPLSPLTGADDEWIDQSECSGRPLWQNNRCSAVFKEADGSCYMLDGVVWQEEDGCCYTNKHSCIPVTFPFTVPETVYRPASEDPARSALGAYVAGRTTSGQEGGAS